MTGRVVEVFSSLQGEGIRLGERQIFVRFGGCNFRCDYCDEPAGRADGVFWDEGELKEAVEALQSEREHRAIAWTGGEPLLQAAFLRRMMAWARDRGWENLLETNGTLPAAFRRVAGLVDVVAMDVKLPSSTGRSSWEAHRRFLEVFPAKIFVKVVLTGRATRGELDRVIALLRGRRPAVPLILQPVTDAARPVPPERVLEWLSEARAALGDVRVVPQWHRCWGMR